MRQKKEGIFQKIHEEFEEESLPPRTGAKTPAENPRGRACPSHKFRVE